MLSKSLSKNYPINMTSRIKTASWQSFAGRRMQSLRYKRWPKIFWQWFLKSRILLWLTLLINRNRLVIHAKCQTIMNWDMQLLHDLWKRINPESAIGADDTATNDIKSRNQRAELEQIERAKKTAQTQVDRAQANGTLHKLPCGLAHFCLMHNLITASECSAMTSRRR